MKLLRKWAGGKPNPDCITIENFISPIIDKIIWERVQERMNNKSHNAQNKAKRTYLLTGLIECEKCGSAYVAHTSKNKMGIEYSTYVCGNKYRTRTCNAKNISANTIEPFVIENLKRYLLETDFQELAEYS